jgi:hypothetical protein
MDAIRLVAILFIIVGVLGLAFGGFSFTKDRHETQIGPVELAVEEKETVNIPLWAGVGAIIVGGGLLLVGGRQRV